METILIKPRNKQELQLVSALMNRMNIRSSIQKSEEEKKKKSKEDFLNSLPRTRVTSELKDVASIFTNSN